MKLLSKNEKPISKVALIELFNHFNRHPYDAHLSKDINNAHNGVEEYDVQKLMHKNY